MTFRSPFEEATTIFFIPRARKTHSVAYSRRIYEFFARGGNEENWSALLHAGRTKPLALGKNIFDPVEKAIGGPG
jgi:hypothetical protein